MLKCVTLGKDFVGTYFIGLGGEKIRWTEQSYKFKAEIKELVGNVLLATGFLSYCGPFNQEFRTYMIKEIWEKELSNRHIPFISDLNLIAMLIDAPTIGEFAKSFFFVFQQLKS